MELSSRPLLVSFNHLLDPNFLLHLYFFQLCCIIWFDKFWFLDLGFLFLDFCANFLLDVRVVILGSQMQIFQRVIYQDRLCGVGHHKLMVLVLWRLLLLFFDGLRRFLRDKHVVLGNVVAPDGLLECWRLVGVLFHYDEGLVFLTCLGAIVCDLNRLINGGGFNDRAIERA